MMGLRQGGRALVVKAGLTPENLGREVAVGACLGFRWPGERICVGYRFVTVNRAGVYWMVRGMNSPLVGMLLRSQRRVNTWELPAHHTSLLPLDSDDELQHRTTRESKRA